MEDELYMERCLHLAAMGGGHVAPNPMVGAVLVHDGRIIGEGYHQRYGEAHAEVNCIRSVQLKNSPLIAQSVLYVSLEPCAHFGKTPPCCDLIIQRKIPKVVIGCRDPFDQVNGKGIEKLVAAGVEVTTGVLEQQCQMLNVRFFTFHQQKRPYIILKWAQTANKKIASTTDKRLIISNPLTNRLVHKWRAEEAAILVGTNTALYDDPALTNRLWNGKNPVRLVVDTRLRLPPWLKIFNTEAPTVVFNYHRHNDHFPQPLPDEVHYYKIEQDGNLAAQIAKACYLLHLDSVLVEGGARLLQSFIDEAMFDEIREISSKSVLKDGGVDAPVISGVSHLITQTASLPDNIQIFL